MKPSENTITTEYNRIERLQRNNGLEVEHAAICNVIAAKYGYRFADVLAIMENHK